MTLETAMVTVAAMVAMVATVTVTVEMGRAVTVTVTVAVLGVRVPIQEALQTIRRTFRDIVKVRTVSLYRTDVGHTVQHRDRILKYVQL